MNDLRVLSISDAGPVNDLAWQVLESRGVTIERLKLAEIAGPGSPRSKLVAKVDRYLPQTTVVHAIRASADRLQPHVVHVGPGRSVALSALRALGDRPDLPVAIERGAVGGLNLLSPIEWSTFFSRRVSKVIVPSYGLLNAWMGRRFLAAALTTGKVEVIHHPLALPAPTDIAARNAERDRLGIPREAFVVGTVCKIRPIKNIAFAARVVASLDRDAVFAVVGGAGEPAVMREIEREGGTRLRLLGPQPGAAAMRAFDVYVTPTGGSGEGFGLATLEAMAAGLPVVATNIGGSGDLVRGTGVGYSLPLREADWKTALETLESDPPLRTRLGAAARCRVEAEFSPDSVAEQTLGLWRRMAGYRTQPA